MAQTKIPQSVVDRWIAAADKFFAENPATNPATRHMVETGVVAWALAGKLGFLNEAYSDRTITDGHIQTALGQVFPMAKFLDAKRY